MYLKIIVFENLDLQFHSVVRIWVLMIITNEVITYNMKRRLNFSTIKDQTLRQIISRNYEKRNAQNQHCLSLLVKEAIKNFKRNLFISLYMTHPLKKELSKNIYDSRKIALSKALNSSYLDCPCSSSLKFFDVALSNLKTAILNLSEFA